MNQKELSKFKELFKELQKNAQLSLVNLDFSKMDTGDEWDHIQEDRDKFLEFKLATRHRFFLRKIKIALEKIKKGSFGACDDCGDDIELARLYARPTANMCINCKEDQEREENCLMYDKRSKTKGPELNNNIHTLKVNGEEIPREKVIKFNRERAKIGLS